MTNKELIKNAVAHITAPDGYVSASTVADYIQLLARALEESEEAKNRAYWERNMLALSLSEFWYTPEQFEDGWSRVIGWGVREGDITFHVPDDFDIGGQLECVKSSKNYLEGMDKWRAITESCLTTWGRRRKND